MKEKHNNKRFDDSEPRNKLELVAELQANQIELELQNDELRRTQLQLEETRDRYADLYDYAPVSYLTLDKHGNVLEINLTGCTLLGLNRASIVDKPFSIHLATGQYRLFFRHLKQTFRSNDNTVSELIVKNHLHQDKYVRLESKAVNHTDTCRMIMTDISPLKAMANLNEALLIENRRLMQNLFSVQEKERRYIARELHDELSQWISAIYAEAETICNSINKTSVAYLSAQSISECTQKMHHVIRRMLYELRPPLLDAVGLKGALLELKKQWVTNHNNISLEYNLMGEFDTLDEEITITLYRIIQESLNNICTHSNATIAQLDLRRETDADSAADALILKVRDNGKGYDTQQMSPGIGILGMRERAVAAGGEFSVRSLPNDGTEIYAKLPILRS